MGALIPLPGVPSRASLATHLRLVGGTLPEAPPTVRLRTRAQVIRPDCPILYQAHDGATDRYIFTLSMQAMDRWLRANGLTAWDAASGLWTRPAPIEPEAA